MFQNAGSADDYASLVADFMMLKAAKEAQCVYLLEPFD
jgi:hypothetical protein